MRVSAQAVAKAVNAANTLRARFGGERLEKLPDRAGYQGDPDHCVLAAAFNFDCYIGPNRPGGQWEVNFPRKYEAHARVLAAELGTPPPRPSLHVEREGDDRGWGVPLPEDIEDIARAFDVGDLPAEFVE